MSILKKALMLSLIFVSLTLLTMPGEIHSIVEAEKNTGQVKLKFVGDIMFAGSVERLLNQHGYKYPYKYVGQHLKDAHLTAANLETSVSTRGTAENKQYAFRSHPSNIPELARAGVDVVTLANNHSMDYGAVSLLDTMSYLKTNKISFVGAGKDRTQAFSPTYRTANGVRVAYLGFSRVVPTTAWMAGTNKPGTAETYNPATAIKSIATAQKNADLVVVLAHWGVERNDLPEAYQKTLARQYIDAGADLVVGSHPHVLQGFEQYKGKWIAYSLGNFIFTTNRNEKTWDSGILTATCTKNAACDLQFLPVLTKYAQPKPMTGKQAETLLQRLSKASYQVKIDNSGKIQLLKK